MDLKRKTDFVKTVEDNKRIIYKIARSYCKDTDDQKDLIQEILIQLWKSFDKFDRSYKFSTWMYRVALNVAISFYRKDSRRKGTHTPLSDEIIYVIPDNHEDEKESKLNLLENFIKELNELDRALMILYLEDKNQKEIAEVLGLSVTNVSTKIGRIKETLRQQFSNIKN